MECQVCFKLEDTLEQCSGCKKCLCDYCIPFHGHDCDGVIAIREHEREIDEASATSYEEGWDRGSEDSKANDGEIEAWREEGRAEVRQNTSQDALGASLTKLLEDYRQMGWSDGKNVGYKDGKSYAEQESYDRGHAAGVDEAETRIEGAWARLKGKEEDA